MTRQKTVSKILELKEFNKERLEAEAGKARERLNLERKNLETLETTYVNISADFTAKQMSGLMPIHEVDLFYTYLKHLNKQIEQQKKIVSVRVGELDKLQLEMTEAYKEQRLFEILHDKITHEQIKESVRGEQKEADYNFLARRGARG